MSHIDKLVLAYRLNTMATQCHFMAIQLRSLGWEWLPKDFEEHASELREAAKDAVRISRNIVALREDVVGIYALDPGTVSGVACGVFPSNIESAWVGLTQSKWDSFEVRGTPGEQAWEIMGTFIDWRNWPNTKWPVHLVFEDFVVRLGPGASSKRELLDPVRVASACEALCINRDGLQWAFPTYQQPSLAKNFATNERLRKHGLWVKGSAHRRDAVRHMARYYASLLG